MARWVEALPAFALTYPDLESGLAGVRGLLAQVGTDRSCGPAEPTATGGKGAEPDGGPG